MRDEMGLTTLERSMWECLARAGGAIVSHRELAVEGLGYPREDPGTELLVRQYVLRIRKKLGEECIRTVRGVGGGYRAVEPREGRVAG